MKVRILLALLLLVGAGIAIAYYQHLLPESVNSLVAQTIDQLHANQWQIDQSSIASQAAFLGERSSTVVKEGSKVLGAAVTVDESNPNETLTDRALGYGRYLYCQQVVSDWEKQHPED